MNYYMVERSEDYDDYFVIRVFSNNKEQDGIMVQFNDFRGCVQTLNYFGYEDKGDYNALEMYYNMCNEQIKKQLGV